MFSSSIGSFNGAVQTGHVDTIEKAIFAGAQPDTSTIHEQTTRVDDVEVQYTYVGDGGYDYAPVCTGSHEQFDHYYCQTSFSLGPAVRTDDITVVRTVIKAGAVLSLEEHTKKCTASDHRGDNPLLDTLKSKSIEIISIVFRWRYGNELLEQAFPLATVEAIDRIWRGSTSLDEELLTNAIVQGRADIVGRALQLGMKLPAFALNKAVQSRNIDTLQLVIQAGAQPCDDKHSNTLDEAISTGDATIIDLVIQAGAKPSASSLNKAIQTKNMNIIRLVLKTGIRICDLNIAIGTGDADIVELVMKETGAHGSLDRAIQTRNARIVELTVNAGAKPMNINYADSTIDVAVSTGDPRIVELAIQAGAKRPDPNCAWLTLHRAIGTGSPAVVRLIIQTGVKSHTNSDPRFDSLALAKGTGNAEIIQLVQENAPQGCCEIM